MFSINGYNIDINVNLDNGLYLFDTESGTGKTRLYWLIRDLMINGERVYAVSYDDVVRSEDIEQMIIKYNPSLIIVDRYDMYITDRNLKLLQDRSTQSIILVDYKGDLDITGKECISDEMCFIDMGLDKIEVYQ